MTGIQFIFLFVLMLAYMGALGLAMAIAIPIVEMSHASQGQTMLVLSAILILGIIAMIPAMNGMVKRVVRFPGEGVPVALAELQRRLEALTGPQTPYTIEPNASGYVLKPRYTDPHWRAQLQDSGTTTITETRIRLDPQRHLATLIDIERSATWKVGMDGVRLGWSSFRGVRLSLEIKKTIDLRSADNGGQPSTTERSSSNDLKQPLMDLLREAGWTARYAIW